MHDRSAASLMDAPLLRGNAGQQRTTLMNPYHFVLNFTLPPGQDDPEACLDALFEAGCDDATVGVGQRGMIGLDFSREAPSAEDALRSAISDVARAIPGATLIQAGPDLVGLTDMADIFGFSRQNMRKYATGTSAGRRPFPRPIHVGEPSLWHLAEIAAWLRQNTSVHPAPEVLEVSKAAARINFEAEQKRIRLIQELPA
jgi:predicted DNA-binding transcriptional regulator AlpA